VPATTAALASPPGARPLTIGVVAFAAVAEIGLITWGHVDVLLRATPGAVLAAVLAIVLFWRPGLRTDATGVEVRNPLRTHRVGWAAIEDIGTRWTMSLVTTAGRISVWSAPTMEAHTAQDAFREWVSADGAYVGRGTFDAATDGYAVHEARARQGGPAGIVTRLWLKNRDEAAASAVVVTRWNVVTIAVVLVLAALTVLGILWP
jgi:hypothetical protein